MTITLRSFADRQFHIVDGKILKIEEQHHPDQEEDQDKEIQKEEIN